MDQVIFDDQAVWQFQFNQASVHLDGVSKLIRMRNETFTYLGDGGQAFFREQARYTPFLSSIYHLYHFAHLLYRLISCTTPCAHGIPGLAQDFPGFHRCISCMEIVNFVIAVY
jgi:hypothetical protein